MKGFFSGVSPASINNMVAFSFSESRLARTDPDVPPPTKNQFNIKLIKVFYLNFIYNVLLSPNNIKVDSKISNIQHLFSPLVCRYQRENYEMLTNNIVVLLMEIASIIFVQFLIILKNSIQYYTKH